MSDYYEYTQDGHIQFRITEDLDGIACVETPLRKCAHLPAAERQAAAQALAGDLYEVVPVPAVNAANIVGHADVKVGDVVEVEAHDGSWLVRGEIDFIYNDSNDWPLLIKAQMFADNYLRPNLDNATVRLVRRAEPDPEQVEALANILTGIVTEDDDPRSLARALLRRGVTVRKEH